jgi:peptidoglycan/xylan/chitin deacetylase (PgdA/CDA1 family)
MRTNLKRLLALTLTLTLFTPLAACKKAPPAGSGTPDTPPVSATPEPTASADSSPPPAADPYAAVRTYWSEDQLTQSWGPDQVVEHLFFHPIIAYPQYAFHESPLPESQRIGLDDWMVTVDEYNKILQSVYDKGYILVAMEDVWSEVTDESGTHMVRNTLRLPEGKKPLIISFDDVNYYEYMLEGGFTSKLGVGDAGQIWAECTDPYTKETFLTQDLDATTILDQFILSTRLLPQRSQGHLLSHRLPGHPGLSDPERPGHQGRRPAPAEFEAYRQSEIDAVMPVIQRLKETGWTFGSHTWGHINLSAKSMEVVKTDTERWAEEVGSLVGPTSILFYPHGARPDGDNDVTQTGPMFQYLQSMGFRVFASVGVESYSKIKTDISAVICDRLHPDGKTLRSGRERERYLQFYDAKDIIDLGVRPDLGVTW